MTPKVARANVDPVRQRTQYSCVAASLAMALKAVGVRCDEDSVDEILGAVPGRGAAWDQAIATAQYFGARVTLVCPCTIDRLKEWTDQGVPVLIAWCPEGRPWGHASCVFDVGDDGTVTVADPNIPDPEEVVREVPREDFYRKWYEPGEKYLVRRTAMAIERDIPRGGKVASTGVLANRVEVLHLGSAPPEVLALLACLPDVDHVGPQRWRVLRDPLVAKVVRDLQAQHEPEALRELAGAARTYAEALTTHKTASPAVRVRAGAQARVAWYVADEAARRPRSTR